MITCKLNGGLGNKMFQIATAYSLARYNEDECAFNLHDKVVHQGSSAYIYKDNVFNKIKELPTKWEPDYLYFEPKYNYVPIPYYNNMELKGYFASEKYFRSYKKEVIDLFKERNLIKDIEDKYSNCLRNSVSMHIRRGDYLKLASILVTDDYYYNALKLLDRKTEINNILVMSDDIAWCKKNLKESRMVFIEDEPDYVDMYLMTLCNHNILAPSSFSWWGSYLNENINKIVYAPEVWHDSEETRGFVDFFCDNWILIKDEGKHRPHTGVSNS